MCGHVAQVFISGYAKIKPLAVATDILYGRHMKAKFIKIRASAQDQELARLVASHLGKSVTDMVRDNIVNLARRHGIKVVDAKDDQA